MVALSGRGWRLAPCLVKLVEEMEERAPGRNTASDGSIGDLAHSSRTSDHNPDENGWVKALDISDDPGNLQAGMIYDRDDFDPDVFGEMLRLRRDRRVSYYISDDRIFDTDGANAWQWREYEGTNEHRSHAHLSVKAAFVNDTSTWFPDSEEDDMTPEQASQLNAIFVEQRAHRGATDEQFRQVVARLDKLEAAVPAARTTKQIYATVKNIATKVGATIAPC
jgi:hypothetical protein